MTGTSRAARCLGEVALSPLASHPLKPTVASAGCSAFEAQPPPCLGLDLSPPLGSLPFSEASSPRSQSLIVHFFCLNAPDPIPSRRGQEASLCSGAATCLPARAHDLGSPLPPTFMSVTSLHAPSPFPQDCSKEVHIAGGLTHPVFSWNCPLAP